MKIKIRNNEDRRKDLLKIQEALASYGYEVELYQCEELWRMFSRSMAASWMSVPSDKDQIVSNIRVYFESSSDEDEEKENPCQNEYHTDYCSMGCTGKNNIRR